MSDLNMKQFRVSMDVWCSDPREFHNLMELIKRAQLLESENGRHGGYGFEVKIDMDENTLRKQLGFKKSDIEISYDH
jgi:hypothetical protein